jgi:UDP-galactopyranose mutase
MPLHGYTKMFQQLLDHPNIHTMLNTDYKDVVEEINFRTLIYSGPIDAYFDFCFGKLPYRSINFKSQTIDSENYQTTGTINYPMSQAYTRITEFKHLTGQKHDKTSIVFEYPTAEGDPYYPIPRKENMEIYNQYKNLAASEPNTFFTGRLGTYKYYNMDQVVAQSLTLFKKMMQSQQTHIKKESHFSSNGTIQHI